MPRALREALHERLRLRTLLFWALAMGGLYVFFDGSLVGTALTALTGGVVGFAGVASGVYDLRPAIERLGLGTVALVCGGALLAFDGGPGWFGAVSLVLGVWTVVDGVQTARHLGATDPAADRDGHEVYREYVTRRVDETIQERSRTRRELGDALEADSAVVDAALDRLLSRAVVERAGSEFRVTESDEVGWIRARQQVLRGLRRVARPLTLEVTADAVEPSPAGVNGKRSTAGRGRRSRAAVARTVNRGVHPFDGR